MCNSRGFMHEGCAALVIDKCVAHKFLIHLKLTLHCSNKPNVYDADCVAYARRVGRPRYPNARTMQQVNDI